MNIDQIKAAHAAPNMATLDSVTFDGFGATPAPAVEPTLADVMAAIARLESKIDALSNPQPAARPKPGYPTL